MVLHDAHACLSAATAPSHDSLVHQAVRPLPAARALDAGG